MGRYTKGEWKAYYAANKDKYAASDKKWRKKNRDAHTDDYYWSVETLPEAFKQCCKCKSVKHVTDFAIARDTKDGFSARCKPCRKWIWTKHKYDLSEMEYVSLLAAQDYECALCGRDIMTTDSHVIDHDHTTGVVRGILCRQCNIGLGAFGDDVDTMNKAIEYVTTYRSINFMM